MASAEEQQYYEGARTRAHWKLSTDRAFLLSGGAAFSFEYNVFLRGIAERKIREA